MKDKWFFMGMLGFFLVFGLFLAGCDNGTNSTTGTSGTTYTVTYNANGGSGAVPGAQTVNAGTSITVAGQGDLTLSGSIFTGWNTSVNGSGTSYAAGSSLTVNANMTLYAQWIIDSGISYTVTYNANGGSGAVPGAQTVSAGVSITVAGQGSLNYSGRTFNGWNTNADGTGTAYTAGSSLPVNANMTLYAQWTTGSGSGDGSALVGKWYGSQFMADNPGALAAPFEFQADGKVLQYGEDINYTYTATGDTISISYSGNTPGTASYVINGSVLTIFNISPGSNMPFMEGDYYKPSEPATLISVSTNGSSTQTSTELILTFDKPIAGLGADNIMIGRDIFTLTNGTLSDSGPVYTLGISNLNHDGISATYTVYVDKPGYIISGSPQTVTLYSPPEVTFINVTANGSATQTTSQLTLTFNSPITGLTAANITLSGVSGVTKGSLSGAGPTYTLDISGFTSSGTLTVAVTIPETAMVGSPQSTEIYYNPADFQVAFTGLSANGGSTQTTSQLTLTFDKPVTGLVASDITLSGMSVTKGSLSGTGPTYTLSISGVSSGGTLNVSVAKPGFTISGSPRTVTVYHYIAPTPPGIPTRSATASGNNITFTWSFPTGDNNGQPNSILVRLYDPSYSVWVNVETLPGTATSYTFNSTMWRDSDGWVLMGVIGTNSYGSASGGVTYNMVTGQSMPF
ncbi:MAG: InlB B-repeat-containing protein [Treponema sp.]|nr:InlB B-repeat-containing protein [Treponema sp.]